MHATNTHRLQSKSVPKPLIAIMFVIHCILPSVLNGEPTVQAQRDGNITPTTQSRSEVVDAIGYIKPSVPSKEPPTNRTTIILGFSH